MLILVALAVSAHRFQIQPQPGRPRCDFFITSDCPIAKSYVPEIKRLIARFDSIVRFRVVYCDFQPERGALDRHARDYGLAAWKVIDPAAIRQFSIKVVPTAVLSRGSEQLYFGRIDNLYYGLGKKRYKVTERSLFNALLAFEKGQNPPQSRTEPIGCFIVTE